MHMCTTIMPQCLFQFEHTYKNTISLEADVQSCYKLLFCNNIHGIHITENTYVHMLSTYIYLVLFTTVS